MKFSVSILFASRRDDDREPLWEERILLVDAPNEEEARAKAEATGHNEQHTFNTDTGTTVTWVFDQVERVCLIDEEIGDGAELFSRFLRESEVKSILTPFDDF